MLSFLDFSVRDSGGYLVKPLIRQKESCLDLPGRVWPQQIFHVEDDGSIFYTTHWTCCTPQTVAPNLWTPYSLITSPRCTGTTRNPSFSLQWKSERALNTTSLKCYLTSTDAINMWEKIHACVWRFKVASCKRTSLKSTRLSQKKVRILLTK